jgi:hypothetical protein
VTPQQFQCFNLVPQQGTIVGGEFNSVVKRLKRPFIIFLRVEATAELIVASGESGLSCSQDRHAASSSEYRSDWRKQNAFMERTKYILALFVLQACLQKIDGLNVIFFIDAYTCRSPGSTPKIWI